MTLSASVVVGIAGSVPSFKKSKKFSQVIVSIKKKIYLSYWQLN